jgi:hypothetical protein
MYGLNGAGICRGMVFGENVNGRNLLSPDGFEWRIAGSYPGRQQRSPSQARPLAAGQSVILMFSDARN